MNVKTGGPAFPIVCTADDGPDFKDTDQMRGLTMRDYFAIRVLAARLSSEAATARRKESSGLDEFAANEASVAYMIADAMIEGRKRE